MQFSKYKFCAILLATTAIIGLSSCLRDNYVPEYPRDDSELTAFSLESSEVPELAETVFTIDQNHGDSVGYIYNRDSLAYGTVFKKKAIISYLNMYEINNVLLLTKTTEGADTTIIVSDGDSLDISTASTEPIVFRTTSYDGNRHKRYLLSIRIHQIDPDSTQYERIANNLSFLQKDEIRAVENNNSYFIYSKQAGTLECRTSDDLINWTAETLSGLPSDVVIGSIKSFGQFFAATTASGSLLVSTDGLTWNTVSTPYSVESILGNITANPISGVQEGGLCVIFNTGSSRVFGVYPLFDPSAYTSAGWKIGDTVSDRFPTRGFESFNRFVLSGVIDRLSVIGGYNTTDTLNTIWQTQDGLKWAEISNNTAGFPPLVGANYYTYDDKFMIVNGLTKSAQLNPNVYTTDDMGIHWNTLTAKTVFPTDYRIRYGAASITSADGIYFYIIGGKNSNGYTPDIWRCYRNDKTFDELEE